MGRNKNTKSKQSHGSKKNAVQLSSYKDFLSDPQNQPEDTVDVRNQHLTGSNYLQASDEATIFTEKPLPPPFRVRAKRFFEAYGVWGIIITTLLSFGVWTVTTIHQHDIAIASLTIRVDYIEQELSEFDVDGISTEQLHAEIDDLKTILESSWGLSLKEIENRINILELLIENLENKTE